MRGLGTCVIIHGKGNDDFQVVINEIVSEEWKRAQARDIARKEQERKELEDAMEWMRFMKQQRDRQRDRNNLREEKIKLLNAKQCKTFKDKAIDKVAFVLACFIAWGEAIMPYLIEYVGDEEEWK